MAEAQWKDARLGTTADEAFDFLEKLATDEDFRANLERNPREVLAEYRIELSEGAIPDTVQLPSMAEAARFLGEAREREYMLGPSYHPLGYAILWLMLGAMPLVSAGGGEDDAAG